MRYIPGMRTDVEEHPANSSAVTCQYVVGSLEDWFLTYIEVL